MKPRSKVVPKEMEGLRQRLEYWRKTHRQRGRLPKTLWAEAAALARQYGVQPTARMLRLEYARLYYWVQHGHEPRGRVADGPEPAEFVELLGETTGRPECVIEWQSRRGKVTIHWKGSLPELSDLSRAFWSQS